MTDQQYCYVLYESYRDDHNYPASRHDLEYGYISEAGAQKEADSRNDTHNSVREQIFFKELEKWEQSVREAKVLFDAGLRTFPFAGERPEFQSERIWFVEEIELR